MNWNSETQMSEVKKWKSGKALSFNVTFLCVVCCHLEASCHRRERLL